MRGKCKTVGQVVGPRKYTAMERSLFGTGWVGMGYGGRRSCVYPQRHNNIRCNRIINLQQRLVIAVAGFVLVHWSNNTSEELNRNTAGKHSGNIANTRSAWTPNLENFHQVVCEIILLNFTHISA